MSVPTIRSKYSISIKPSVKISSEVIPSGTKKLNIINGANPLYFAAGSAHSASALIKDGLTPFPEVSADAICAVPFSKFHPDLVVATVQDVKLSSPAA